MPAPTTRSYAVGQFEFALENEEPFLVKAIEGGLPRGNVVEEQIGTDVHFIKHLSTVEIEPMSIELGMQESIGILKWIQQSWNKDYQRKSGWVRHADWEMKEMLQAHFVDALITETSFPTLDATSKETAVLKVKMQPESVDIERGNRRPLKVNAPGYQKQKLWTAASFAFELQGIDMSRTAKIEGFTVKQGVKSYSTGRARFPHWEPTKLSFPDLTVYLSLAYAEPLIEWYTESMKGAKDPSLQKHGSIRYLAPNKQDTVFEVELFGVGIKGLAIDKSERQDQVKKVKAELYVSEMKLVTSGVLATSG